MLVNGLRVAIALCVLAGFTGLAGAARAAGPASESIVDVSMEVWALQGLRDLDLTVDQLKALKGIAGSTASALGDRDPPKVNDKYVAKLKALRDALEAGQDDDAIDALQDEVDTLQDDDEVDVDDSVTISDAARGKASLVVKFLTSAQIASYIANYEDESPDPVQSLMDAADDIRDTDDEDAKDVIDETIDEVATLVAGLEVAKERPVAEKVRAYLVRARKMNDAEFKAKQADLEKAAKEIVGDTDGFVILRHWMMRDMAELLSNPRLEAAIEARLKSPRPVDAE